MRRYGLFAAFLFGVLSISANLMAGPVVEKGRLYLNAGAVDTAQLPNLKASRAAAFEDAKIYVIQLDSAITPQRRAALRNAGVVLGEYLPHFAYVASLRGAKPDALAAMDFVSWIGEFRNEWKLDPELGRRAHVTAERQAMAAQGETPVIVTLFEHHGAGKVLETISRLPGAIFHYVEDEGGTIVVSATAKTADINSFAALEDVQYVEEAPEITLRNATTRWIIQSNVLDSTPVWAHGIIGVGQVLGHMDGKINMSHCAFFDPVNNTPGPSHRKVVAYNESLGYDQHGTHTADTGAGDDYQGSTGNLRGMAYGAKISHSAIPGFTDTGFYNAAATQYGQGARCFTNSWGDDGTTSYNGLCRGVDRFSYDNEDALVMFAVTNTSALKNPENAKNLLAVGASQDTPNQANFCSGGTGPTVDGRRKPEIYAPGCSTNSASGSGSVCTTAALTGTSMASPAVTGVALLVREYYMDGFSPSGAATPANAFTPSGALIKATLLNSAVDMTGVAGYPSNKEGWGRLLVDNALYFSGDARKLAVLADVRNAGGFSTGQNTTYNLNVTGSTEQLRVTLVWTDPPASASTGTANAAINDLDLEVTAPNASLYLGNVFSGGASATGGTKDALNNVEQVHVNAPAAGVWTITVRAAAVNSGTQGYAVIATGEVVAQGTAPIVTSTNPPKGSSGRSISSCGVYGSNFQVFGSTTVKLAKAGEPDIFATSVGVVDSSTIGCNFDLTTAVAGYWDVVVVNPDSQSGSLVGGFLVEVSCSPGDVNRDGLVDGNDIQRFAEMLVNGDAIPVERCAGDLDPSQDGIIDELDVDPFANCVLAGGCP